MMSSEEDVTVDSFGVLKKTKRARQRVDAGEPRNSYSSIPNFSSRPTILNSSIYGAFFAAGPNQQQQPPPQSHFGGAPANGLSGASAGIGGANGGPGTGSAAGGLYFGQVGFGPTKMLNELLRSRVKTGSALSGADNGDAMMSLDVAAAANDAVTAISGAAYECLGSQSPMNCAGGPLNGAMPMGGGSPPVGDMAQHMLRNILQGVGRSKKDLYALERELREASNLNNNNNNSHNNNETELSVDCVNETALNNNNGNHVNNNHSMGVDEDETEEVDEEEDELEHNDGDPIKPEPDDDENGGIESADLPNGPMKSLTNGNVDDMDAATDTEDKDKPEVSPCHDKLNDCSASERSVSSPESVSNNNNNIKEDPDEPIKESSLPQKSEQKELKRARVENIVSGMRSSPLPVPVNGCKKRKLYHPQQHDNSVAERYPGGDVVDTLSEDEDETLCSAEIRKKVVEKNALKNQLRTVQEQLVEMQQKYVQLCTRIEQDPMEMDETTSDIDQDDDTHSIASPVEKARVPTPVAAICKESFSVNGAVQASVTPAIPKILSSKFLPERAMPTNVPHLNPHNFPLHPNFNGAALSFLQHQIFQEQQHAAAAAAAAAQNHLQSHHHPHHHNPTHGHPAFNNAAAMYLGVGQKLLLEQEARLAKEAALAAAAEHHHQQQQSQAAQAPQTIHPPPSSSPHHQQSAAQHLGHSSVAAAKDSCSPGRVKSDQSPATPANASSSLSSVSSTSSSSSSSSLSQQQPQQQVSAQPSTKNSADTTTAPTATNTKNTSTSNNGLDLDGLADSLKTEISTTLATLIDTIMTRFLQQKRALGKTAEAEQPNKDLYLGSHLLDRKSPRTKVIDRGNCGSAATEKSTASSSASHSSPSKGHPLASSTNSTLNFSSSAAAAVSHPENNINALNVAAAARSGFGSNLFAPPKLGSGSLNSAAAAAALYSSMTNSLGSSHLPFCMAEMRPETAAPEQNEALSLVVPTKKKRHKVTDTRITPRTVSRILAQDGMGCPPPPSLLDAAKYGLAAANGAGGPDSPPPPPPPPRPFHHVPHSAAMLPVSLPTSVAIPNPSLHESQVFSPYSPFYGAQHQPPHHIPSSSPPGMSDHIRDSPPLPHHPSIFHPALLAAAQQQQQHQQQQQREHQQQQQREQQSHHQRSSSPSDFMNLLPNSGPGGESLGPDSECNSMDFDGLPPTISFLRSTSDKLMLVF